MFLSKQLHFAVVFTVVLLILRLPALIFSPVDEKQDIPCYGLRSGNKAMEMCILISFQALLPPVYTTLPDLVRLQYLFGHFQYVGYSLVPRPHDVRTGWA